MAKAVPEPGQQVKQTTYTEVLPASAKTADVEKLGFWEYLLSLTPNDYAEHICYVYRWLANSNDYSAVGKLSLPFDEFTLKDNFGGGTFRLYLKRKGQLYKRIDRVVIEGNPKNPDDAPASGAANGVHGTTELTLLAQILAQQSQLFEKLLSQNNNRPMVDEAMRGALDLQRLGFSNVVTSVRELTPQPAAPSSDPFKEKLFDLLLTRAFAPPPSPADPIKTFVEMAAAVKQILPDTGGNTSWGVEAIRALGPALAPIAQAITAGYTSQMPRPPIQHPNGGRTIDVSAQPQPVRANSDDTRNNVTPMPGPAPTANAALPASPDAANTPAPPENGEVNQVTPNLEWLEAKVVDLVNHPQLSPEDAASDAVSFLQTAAPDILAQMSSEFNLRWVFKHRPIMQRISDPEKKERFIVAFLQVLNGTPAPAAAPEPADTLLLKPDPPPAS